MTGSSHSDIIEETLQYSLSDEVNAQDVMFFFVGSSMNTFARRAVTDFALKNFDTVRCSFAVWLAMHSCIVVDIQAI